MRTKKTKKKVREVRLDGLLLPYFAYEVLHRLAVDRGVSVARIMQEILVKFAREDK